jgi:hypothetical protein
MKTKIILYSIIAFLGLALVFAFKKAQVSDTNSKFVIVRVLLPGPGAYVDAKILIKDETGQTREIDLKQGYGIKPFELFSTELLKVLNEYDAKGYKLISSNGGDYFSTYIWAKE